MTVRRSPKSRTSTVPLMTFVSVPLHLSSVSHSVPNDAPQLSRPRTRTFPPRRLFLRAALSPARSEFFAAGPCLPTSTRSLRGEERAARFARCGRVDDPRQSGSLPASRSSVTGRRPPSWCTPKRPRDTDATWRPPARFLAVTRRTASSFGSTVDPNGILTFWASGKKRRPRGSRSRNPPSWRTRANRPTIGPRSPGRSMVSQSMTRSRRSAIARSSASPQYHVVLVTVMQRARHRVRLHPRVGPGRGSRL